MNLEPKTKIFIQDLTQGLDVIPDNTDFAVFCPVYTDSGPLGQRRVTSLKEFVDLYLANNGISETDHTTVFHVAKALRVAPMYVSRVCRSSMLAGMTDSGQEVYLNKSKDIIPSLLKVDLTESTLPQLVYYMGVNTYLLYTGDVTKIPSEVSSLYTTLVSLGATPSIDTLFSGAVNYLSMVGIATYTTPSNEFVTLGQVKDKSSNIKLFVQNQRSNRSTIITNKQTNSIEKTVREGDYLVVNETSYYVRGTGAFDPSPLLNPVPISSPLNSAEILSSYFLSQVHKKLNSADSIKLSYGLSYTFTGITSVSLDDYLQEFFEVDGLTIKSIKAGNLTEGVISFTLEDSSQRQYTVGLTGFVTSADVSELFPLILEDLIVNDIDTVTIVSNSTSQLIFENSNNPSIAPTSSALSKLPESTVSYSVIHSTDANNDTYTSFTDLWIRFGETVFYVGSEPSVGDYVYKKLGTNKPYKVSEFLTLVSNMLPIYFLVTINTSPISYVFGEEVEVEAIDYIEINETPIDQSNTEGQFMVVQKFPISKKIIQFSYSKNVEDTDIIDFTLTFKGNTSTYQFSFTPDKVDPFGVSYDPDKRINETNEFIEIVSLGGQLVNDTYTSSLFGDLVKPEQPSDQAFIDIIQSIRDTDQEEMNFDVIWDCGHTSGAVSQAISAVCDTESSYSFYPSSLPPSYTDPNLLITYKESTGIDSPRTFFLAGGYKDSTILQGGKSVYICGSWLMLNKLINNYKSNSSEFDPIFANNGIIPVTNLIQRFKTSDRDLLLGKQIVTLKEKGGNFFINLNRTSQKINSYLEEENISRITNKSTHVLGDYMESLTAKINDATLRDLVTRQVTLAMFNRLKSNKNYSYQTINVVCNETNNPIDIINARKIVCHVYFTFSPSIVTKVGYSVVLPLTEQTQ